MNLYTIIFTSRNISHTLCPSTAEDVRNLKSRVAALESTSTAAHTSRLSASNNDIHNLQSGTYMDPGGAARSDNTLNLDTSLGMGMGTGTGTGIAGHTDNAALQRTIQQLLRAEMQSQSFRGIVHTWTWLELEHKKYIHHLWYMYIKYLLNSLSIHFFLLFVLILLFCFTALLPSSMKGDRGEAGTKGKISCENIVSMCILRVQTMETIV